MLIAGANEIRLSQEWVSRYSRAADPDVPAAPAARRVVIYARYSTRNQKESSVERQIERGQKFTRELNGVHVASYTDRERSGSRTHDRDALETMMAASRRREFDVVVVESWDRLSRDLGDGIIIFRELQELDIELYAVDNGRIDLMRAAFEGLRAETEQTRRTDLLASGRRRAATDGLSTGPILFGLKRERPGKDVPDPVTAPVVERIFDAAMSMTPAEIAIMFNDEGLPAPKPNEPWNSSRIRRILSNYRYAGVQVWGKTRCKKDRTTGLVRVEKLPQSEWLITSNPEVALVSRENFDLIQKLIRERSLSDAKTVRRPKYLLSGKMKCCCGSKLYFHASGNKVRARCSSSFGAEGLCENRFAFPLELIEQLLLSELRERLCDPELNRQAIRRYNAAVEEQSRQRVLERDRLDKDITDLDAEIQKIFEMQLEGFSTERVRSTVEKREDRLRALKNRRATLPNPRLVEFHIDSMRDLDEAFAELLDRLPFQPKIQAEFNLRERIRDLLIEITLLAAPDGKHFALEGSAILPSLHGLGIEDAGFEAEVRFRITSDNASRCVHNLQSMMEAMRTEPQDAISDDLWSVLEPLVPRNVVNPAINRRQVNVDARLLLEAVIFKARTAISWKRLPERFGDRTEIRCAMVRLIYAGGLSKIRDAIAEHQPELLEGVDLDQFQGPQARDYVKNSRLVQKTNEKIEQWARDGLYRLTDEQYAAVKDLVSENVVHPLGKPKCSATARDVIDAIILKCRSKAAWAKIPSEIGDHREVYLAVCRLVDHGDYDEIVKRLQERFPDVLKDVDLEPMASFKRHKSRRRSSGQIEKRVRRRAGTRPTKPTLSQSRQADAVLMIDKPGLTISREVWDRLTVHLPENFLGPQDRGVDLLVAVNVALIKARTGVSWPKSPCRGKDYYPIVRAFSRLVYCGSWDRIVAELRAKQHTCVRDIDPTFSEMRRSDNVQVSEAASPLPERFEVPKGKPIPHQKLTRLRAAIAARKMCETGSTAMSDEIWASLEGLLPLNFLNPIGNRKVELSERQLLDRILIKLRSRAAWGSVPMPSSCRLYSAAERLVYHGSWTRIRNVLTSSFPEFSQELDFACMQARESAIFRSRAV